MMKVRGARGWEDKKGRAETYLCPRGKLPRGAGLACSSRASPQPSQCSPRAGKCHPNPG